MRPLAGSASRRWRRTGAGALALVLVAGAGACGRRGPPLAPLQVDPEPPRVLPLTQEDGQVTVRWYAPRLDSGGDPADLRLRKAIVSYRVLDLHALAAEERANQRRPPEEVDEEEPEETSSGEEETGEAPDPESPGTEEGAAPDAAAPETVEPAPGEETPPPDAEAPESSEAETEDQPPEGAPPGEPPAPQPPAPAEEQSPAGGAPPEEAEPEPEAEMEPEPGTAAEPEQETGTEQEQEAEPEAVGTQEEPDLGEPAGEETAGEIPPEPEPEPTGTLLDYDDLEFELLSEIESEVPGEEQVLELPVEPDWIGRRLEITVRYEARGGASDESEPRSLDVTGPLPVVEGVVVEVGPRELTVHWEDPRGALGATLAEPLFEVFRRRGEESERLGRSFGPSQADPDVVWGEEVCYRARLVVAGGEEERVIPDPGPAAPAGPGEEAESAAETPVPDPGGGETPSPDPGGGEDPAPDPGAAETPAPVDAAEAGAPETPAPESPDPQEEALPPEEPGTGVEPWSPIPIRIPGAGPGAASVGPMSAEACVVPVDVFPPVPPSDLRLLWRTEQTDLSWRESASTDVTGYHVYRSGPDGAGFERLTQSPVDQTSFTDAARDPRGAFSYAITAVDGADPPNESLPSDSRRVNPR